MVLTAAITPRAMFKFSVEQPDEPLRRWVSPFENKDVTSAQEALRAGQAMPGSTRAYLDVDSIILLGKHLEIAVGCGALLDHLANRWERNHQEV